MFKFCQELFVHPCRPLSVFARLPACWHGLPLGDTLEYQPASLGPPLPTRALFHGTFSSRSLKRLKSGFLKSRVVILLFDLPTSPWDSGLHLMVRTAKTAFHLHIPDEPFFVSMRFSQMPLLIGSSITCVGKLSLTLFRNLLGCLRLAV